MSTRPKRVLRNGNTCPSVANPLRQEGQQIQQLLPPQMLNHLTAPHLTCPLISALPPLAFPGSAAEALSHMRAAREWQSGSVRVNPKCQSTSVCGQQQEGGIFDNSDLRMLGSKTSLRPQREDSIYSVLFEHDLHAFIMNSPVHCPFEFDEEPQYLCLPSSKNDFSLGPVSQFDL